MKLEDATSAAFSADLVTCGESSYTDLETLQSVALAWLPESKLNKTDGEEVSNDSCNDGNTGGT